MASNRLLSLAGLVLIGSFLAEPARADGLNPGSLMIFPEFDHRAGLVTVITLTNTYDSTDHMDTVEVNVIYIDGDPDSNEFCGELDFEVDLSPNDTFSFVTNAQNPDMDYGYLYAFPREAVSNKPVSFNWLIGNTLVFDGMQAFQYSHNPAVFRAIPEQGEFTDLEPGGNHPEGGDGVRDMDGVEYEMVPDRFYVPRHFGQGPGTVDRLVLVALTGGTDFTTILDFLSFNDNEEVFSRTYSFDCWDKVALADISHAFDNDFLDLYTNNDPDEIQGFPDRETGWFFIDGRAANSTLWSFPDPAFLAVLVETRGGTTMAAAEMPFHSVGTQDNGDLLPSGPFGDS